MNDNKKLHFHLSQEIYHNNKLSHTDEIKHIYCYETIQDDGKEIILNCIETTCGASNDNVSAKKLASEIDKFRLKINKDKNIIDISRHGIVKSDMLFSINEKSTFIHDSYIGKIKFTLDTTNIDIADDSIEIVYDLLNENELLSKNIIKINFL